MACMASSSLGPLTPLSKLQIAPSATHLSLQQGGFCQSHALASRHRDELRQGFRLPFISSKRRTNNVTCEAGTDTEIYLWKYYKHPEFRFCLQLRASRTAASENSHKVGKFDLWVEAVNYLWSNLQVSTSSGTEWLQRTIELPVFKRGCHVITQHIYRAVPELGQFKVGTAHLFIMHTSASLTINENASPDVPLDMEDTLNRIVPEGHQYRHLDEGFDDMPAHVKASMMGSSLTVPITSGRFNLGTWQGIWLNEHRNYGGFRSICITIQGEKRVDGRTYK